MPLSNAEAWTWLDRQMHRQAKGNATDIPFNPTLEQAAEDRRRWMIEHGFAAMEGGRYVLRQGSAETLRQREWQQFQQTYQEQFEKPARLLLPDARAKGRYYGTVSLHDGLYAVIASPTDAALASVQRVPPLEYGARVEATTNTRGPAVLSRLDSREAGKAKKDRGAERD